jgi:hypothetical protein
VSKPVSRATHKRLWKPRLWPTLRRRDAAVVEREARREVAAALASWLRRR